MYIEEDIEYIGGATNDDFSEDLLEISSREIEYNKIKSSEKYSPLVGNSEKSIFNNTIGLEAYTQLLPTTIKMGRLFKMKESSSVYKKSMLLLRQFTNTAFIPLVDTTEKVAGEVKTCFGSTIYKRMMYNYIFPKKYQYKNKLIPGSKKKIVLTNLKYYKNLIDKHLPRLQNEPTFYVKNFKNTVYDISEILKLSWPTDMMCRRPNVLSSSDNLMLQMIASLIFGDNTNSKLYEEFNTNLIYPSKVFENIIISVPVKSVDMKLATTYLNLESSKIPVSIRKKPEEIMILGLINFAIRLLDTWEYSSDLETNLADAINKKQHVLFLFHNDTHGFYIDPQEFKENNLKYSSIFRLVKLSLKSLIALNSNIINSVDIKEEDIKESELVTDDNDTEVKTTIDKKIEKSIKFKEEMYNIISNKDNSINESILSLDKMLKENIPSPDSENIDKDIDIKNLLFKTDKNLKERKATLSPVDIIGEEEDEIPTSEDDEDIISDDEYDLSPEGDEDINLDEIDDTDIEEEELDDSDDFLTELEEEEDIKLKEKIIEDTKKLVTPKLTARETARLEVLHNKYKSIKFDDDRTMDDILKDLNTVTIDTVKSDVKLHDDSFNYSSLKDMTSSYLNKTFAKDMVSIVKFFSEDKSLNMHITNFKKENISDQFNSLELYEFILEDDNHKKHKIKFKLPKVDSDGFMMLNGNRKYLKKQWILKPVTKTNQDTVYMVSSYNKTYITRQGRILNKNIVVLKKLLSMFIDNEKYEKDIVILSGNNTNSNKEYLTSIEYDNLAEIYHRIVLKPKTKDEITFYFSQTEIRNIISENNFEYKIDNKKIPIAIDSSGKVIDIDAISSSESVVKLILQHIEKLNIYPDLNSFISKVSVPKRRTYSRIELQSKKIPLIVFLSSLFTFDKVMEVAGIDDLIFIPKGKKINEYIENNIDDFVYIQFEDGRLYYKQYPIENTLLLNGLSEIDTSNIKYLDKELNELAVYLDYIYETFLTRNLYKGWTAFKELFINPKTKDILEYLKLPTDFLELFIYANSLLADNSYTSSSDASIWRIRDYEVFNELLYETVSENYRVYKQKGKTRNSFSIPEDDILKKLNKSFLLDNYDATNPLNELRARSSITYKGPKGINSSRAFSVDKRGQTRSTVGTVGMSSIENANVGIVKQLTINPRVISTMGFIDVPKTDKDVDNIPASSLLTAEEASLPFVLSDDPKRIGFASGQTKHVIPAEGFDCPLVGTGFEQSVIYKISDDFGYKAKQNGVISAVNDVDKFIVIKYSDGSTERIEYGNRYNRNSDFFLGNNLECNVKEGESVKAGQVITYNKDFFKKHAGKLMYTQGAMARIAITEGEVTEEDSSAISESLSKKLTSTILKKKQIVLGQNANIVKHVNIGEYVRYGDPLVLYEDAKDASSDMSLLELLGETDENTLDNLTRHKGSANYTGTIVDIKVYWTVDPNLMGESSKKFINQYKRKLREQINYEEQRTGVKSSKRVELEVSVPSKNGNRINGAVIPNEGGILIEYYISHTANKRPGDKITVNSSLKSVTAEIIPDELSMYRINSQSKFNKIDCEFSLIGIDNRKVTSVYKTGILSKLLFEFGKTVAEEFFEESGL